MFRRGNKEHIGVIVGYKKRENSGRWYYQVKVGDVVMNSNTVSPHVPPAKTPEVHVPEHPILPLSLLKKQRLIWREGQAIACGYFYKTYFKTASHVFDEHPKVGEKILFYLSEMTESDFKKTTPVMGEVIFNNVTLDVDSILFKLVADKAKKIVAYQGPSVNVASWEPNLRYSVGLFGFDAKKGFAGASVGWSENRSHLAGSDMGFSGGPLWDVERQQVLGTHLGGIKTKGMNEFYPFALLQVSLDKSIESFVSKNGGSPAS